LFKSAHIKTLLIQSSKLIREHYKSFCKCL